MFDKSIIIAEAGVNHNGDIDIARELIDSAKLAGADYIKFQTFSANDLVVESSPKALYQIRNNKDKESQYEMLKNLEINDDFHNKIFKHCMDMEIGFLSSAFSEKDILYLKKFNMDFLKIPSGEITNFRYLKLASNLFSNIILSTGMSNLSEIRNAINLFKSEGINEKQIFLLQCTSEYPTNFKNVNLKVLNTFKNQFSCKIGYSDHTLGIEVAIAAISFGCKLIEKHLTLNKNMKGPDHLASIEPKEFKNMVTSIRNVEEALGSHIKVPSNVEMKNLRLIRKSIVAKNKIHKGDIFSLENICCMRPGYGICASKFEDYLGLKSNYDYNKGDLIK